MLVLCHELPPGSLRSPQRTHGASACHITACLETRVPSVGRRSKHFYDFTRKTYLQLNWQVDSKGYFLVCRRAVVYKPAKMWMASPQNTLTLAWSLELDVLISVDHTWAQRRGCDTGVPVLPLYFPIQSCLFGWLTKFEPGAGEGRDSSQAVVFQSFP